MAFNFLSLQYSVRSVLREAMVGTISAADIPATVAARAGAVGVNVDPGKVKICPLADFPTCAKGNAVSDRPLIHGITVSLMPRGILGSTLGVFTNFELHTTAISKREVG